MYNWQFTPTDGTVYNTICGTVQLTVIEDVLVSISASGTLTKTAYVYGDIFSSAGLTVTAHYLSGMTKDVTALVTNDSSLRVGQTSVTLNYEGEFCTVDGITVAKKQISVSDMSWSVPAGNDAVYSGTQKTAVLNGTLPDGVTVEKAGYTGTNVGIYTATATFSLANGYSSDNYEIDGVNPLTAAWSITAKTLEDSFTVDGVNASYIYTGEKITPAVSVKDGNTALSLGVDYDVSYGSNTTVAEGGSVIVTLKGNYSGEKTVNFTINPEDQADFNIYGENSAVYGGPAITLSAAGGSGSGAITWKITSGSEFAEITGNGSTATLTIKGAGTVVVEAAKATDGNYNAKVDTHEITISKATLTADDFLFTPPTPEYTKTPKTADAVCQKQGAGAVTVRYYLDSALTNVAADTINVGTYYVGITVGTSANYNEITAPLYMGSFAVTARAVTVTDNAQTMKYGSAVPELTYTHNLLAGDSFTGSLATTATSVSIVGTYDITVGDLASANYVINFTGAALTVIKADGPDAPTVNGNSANNGMTYTYTVNEIDGAEYSMDGIVWQDSNVFAGLSAGRKYIFYARIKENANVQAGAIGCTGEVDLNKLPCVGKVEIDGWTYGENANAPRISSDTNNPVESCLYESTDGKGYSSATPPTDAGAYKLTVTFAVTVTHNGTTVSDSFTIAKAEPNVTAPVGLSAIYGDTLAGVQLPAGWAWMDAAGKEVGNAGENTFGVIYTHPTEAANYNQVEADVTITVVPKAVTAVVAVVGDNFIFTGSEQKPGVTVKDGDTNITIPEGEYTVIYKENINAGTATVTVADKIGGNYTVSGETTFVIAKKASAALSGVERAFMRTIATTGNEIDVEALLPDDHGNVVYTITTNTYTVLENVAIDADGKLVFDTKTSAAAASDTITVRVEMQNYTDVTLTVSVILNEKTPLVISGVSAADGLIYNGNAQQGYTGAPASVYTGAYEITYTGRDNSYNSSAAPVNAGDYTVSFKIPDTDLYYSGNTSVNFSIGKAQATVTADNTEVYVGNRMPELTYEVVGLIGSDTLSVALSCDANMSRAGETPIVVTASDPNGNYEITTVNGTLTVKSIILPLMRPTYPPTINDNTSGDVAVSHKSPAQGDTVTFTPVPDVGFEVDKVSVIDKNGRPVNVIDNGNGTYSFRQPNGKVTIDVTFKESIPSDKTDVPCSGNETCPLHGFADLDSSAWYHDGVHFCIENGLMTGYDDGTFHPGTAASRAMIITMLWRLEGMPVVNYLMRFDDVTAGQWYTEAIRWAVSEKIAEGYGDGVFGTHDAVTREQLVTILFRYAQKKGYDVSVWENTNILSYDDAFGITDWAVPAMQWACGESMIRGIPDGDKLNLDPRGNATRAQTATLLMRFCFINFN